MVAHKQENSHSSGGWIGMVDGWEPSSWSQISVVSSHGRRWLGARWGLFYKSILCHDWITSQRPHNLIPSPWGFGFQCMNIWGTQILSIAELIKKSSKVIEVWLLQDIWVAQSVKHLPSVQVMISGSWDQAPWSGSLLSPESVSPSPWLPPACAWTLSLS